RGFAVVAQEVRQLADESARAAEDVAQTTTAIRKRVDEVTVTMGAGQTKVHQAAGVNREVTDHIGERAQQVSARAVNHAAGAQEVSAAAEKQGASTEE